MPNRHEHQQEVRAFLQNHFSYTDWNFSLPHGSGKESYFVQGNEQRYFVKVGVHAERYLTMAEIGLTAGGETIIVQSFIEGKEPSRKDYRERMNVVAEVLHKLHNSPQLKEVLEAVSSDFYKDAGLLALGRLRQKWERYKAQVPSAVGFVEQSLEQLENQINQFTGEGLVASHGDICNANWLFASDRKIYLIDFDMLKMDDPAFDMGALLWWYYPPELRESFLEMAGYGYEDDFKLRMQVRMAMHCLDILLPRANSFDQFKPESFPESLRDFRAILDGKENPEGYE